MYTVYILYSKCINKYYIGVTSNIKKRIIDHNLGLSKKAFTKRASDWIIVYEESYENKSLALKREKKIKAYKGGNAFKKLIFMTR